MIKVLPSELAFEDKAIVNVEIGALMLLIAPEDQVLWDTAGDIPLTKTFPSQGNSSSGLLNDWRQSISQCWIMMASLSGQEIIGRHVQVVVTGGSIIQLVMTDTDLNGTQSAEEEQNNINIC